MKALSPCPICSKNAHFLVKSTDFTLSKQEFEIFLCDNCQTAFTKNPPTADQIGQYYQSEDYISHSNTQKGFINKLYHFARKMMLASKRNLVEKLNGQKPKTILDIGCGTGYFLDQLQQNSWQTLGIEADEKTRRFAQQNFKLKVLNGEDFWQISQKFQVISLWHVLEHLYDLDAYFVKFNELLEDDGVLIIAVPNHWAAEQKHYGKYWAAWDVPRHLWHFSPKSMVFLANKFGFDVVSKKIMPFDPFYIALLSEKYKKNPLAIFSGFWQGFLSFLKSLSDTDKASSVIYVLKKK